MVTFALLISEWQKLLEMDKLLKPSVEHLNISPLKSLKEKAIIKLQIGGHLVF